MPYAADDAIDGLYSPAISVNRIFRAHGHQFMYDSETLSAMLSKVGFTEIAKRCFGNSNDASLILDSPDREIEGRKPLTDSTGREIVV